MSSTENSYSETDLGNISPNPRGEYDPETSYEYLDLVNYKGGSYLCLAELETTVTGVAPAHGKNTDTWQLLTLPGDLTPEYIAMHDDVVNKAEQVEASRAAVEQSQQEIEAAQTDVQQLHSDTVEAAQEASDSRNSAAGYAQAAETSRQAAAESEQNVNAQITGFDTHVSESVTQAQEEIAATRQQAIRAVASQQVTSTQAVKDQTASYITEKETSAKTEIGNYTSEKVAEINNKVSEANITLANTIADGTSLKTQLETTISTADTSKKNLDASDTAAGKTKTALDISNTTATKTKADLDASNTTALEAKTELDATNKTAADLVVSLGDKITESTRVKTDIQTTGETAMSNLQAEATKQQEYIKTSIDDTLSISGKAADAAVAGKKINSLKEDLDDSNILYNNILQIKNTINMLNPNKLKTGKVIGSNGEVIDGLSTRSTSELINVNPSIKLRVTTELYQSLAQYDSTGNKLAYTDTFNSLNPIDLNEDTKYIRICVWNDTLPFMLYQSDEILSYTDYGKYSENVRELVNIYASDTEEEIYLKLYDACNKGNCDVYWEYGVYEFSTIFELIKTKYGKVTAYELPIGGNCRYFFNGSTIIGTGISSDSNVINNSSIFGSWRKAQSYELHDGIFIANHLIYCVHEEASSSPIPYRTKYHNLRMFHNTVTDDYDITIGLRKCIGAGTGLHPNVEVSNCYFQTDHGKDIGWHGHNSDDKTTSYINIHNCYFSHGISTDNLSTNETVELIFNGNSAPIIPITNHNGVKGWKVFAWNNEKRSN